MIERTNVLGVGVSAITIPIATDTIESWIASREQHFVTITGVHGVMESQKSPELRDIHNRAGLVTPDGMPLVWLSHWAGRRHVRRVYGPDLMLALSEISARKGYRQYYFGGGDGVAEMLSDRLTTRFSGLTVAGTFTPPFRPMTEEEDNALVEEINAARPDILWVGLSTPKQERWMAAHMGRLEVPVMIGVGAAFDFHAGLKKQAPAWIQQRGLEWAFRLATEPRRLWRRYLTNNPAFIALVAMQKLGLRRYPDGWAQPTESDRAARRDGDTANGMTAPHRR